MVQLISYRNRIRTHPLIMYGRNYSIHKQCAQKCFGEIIKMFWKHTILNIYLPDFLAYTNLFKFCNYVDFIKRDKNLVSAYVLSFAQPCHTVHARYTIITKGNSFFQVTHTLFKLSMTNWKERVAFKSGASFLWSLF
jgi:hypothetical protein